MEERGGAEEEVSGVGKGIAWGIVIPGVTTSCTAPAVVGSSEVAGMW